MDNKLAYEILKLVGRGISGLEDIKTLLKANNLGLRDEQIVEVINDLKKQECINNLSDGHPKTYILAQKDCLNYYKNLVERETNRFNEDEETKQLQKEKLRIDVALGKKVLKTYRFTRAAAIFGFISGIVLLVLKLLEVLDIIE